MNTYEAIYVRKSVRTYSMESVGAKVLEGIRKLYEESESLFGRIDTELLILENRRGKKSFAGLASVKAPYYLALYSEEKEKYMMNAGFVMQHLSLYLTSKGLGSCFVGMHLLPGRLRSRNGKPLVCLLAFGKAKNGHVRKAGEVDRHELREICVYKEKPRLWMNQLLEAARLAPSSRNCQPWRFVVYDNRIHVFSRNYKAGGLGNMEINFGILFCNMMVVAEELWLDVDMIRLDGISQKNFTKGHYVLSMILRV